MKDKSTYYRSVIEVIAKNVLFKNLNNAGDIDAALPCVTNLLIEKINYMPGMLRTPMKILTLYFDWSSVLFRGRFFRNLNEKSINQHIESWQHSSISVFRDYIKFFEKMTIFIYYSQKESSSAINS